METKINIKELKQTLNHFIKQNRDLQSRGLTPVAVNVVGEAGIGKTSAIQQLAKENNLAWGRKQRVL
jgi:DNA transposition AAA+ family ATPase